MLTDTPIKTKWLCKKCLVYPQLKTIVNEMTGHTYYLVECPECLCHTGFYETEDEAKAAWDDKKVPRTYIIDDIIDDIIEDKNKSMKTDSNKLWDKVKTVFGVAACIFMVCIILYGGCYVLPIEFIKATNKARAEAQRTIAERMKEQRKPFPVQYEGRNFHKVVLEGHEFFNVLLHDPDCSCNTNKVEVTQ